MPSPKIPGLTKAKKNNRCRIGAFEPSLYGTIIHAALTLLAYFK